ncbi:MAG: porin family protein [Pseudomonadota bacterium]
MQRSKFIFITSFILAAPVVPPAIAQDFYAEGFAGVADFGEINNSNNPSFSTFGGRLGAKVTSNFSIEGEALFGNTKDTVYSSSFFVDPLNPSEPISTARSDELGLSSIYSVFGKADIPITDRLSAFGRIGVTYAEFEEEVRTVPFDSPNEVSVFKRSQDDVGFAFGVGAKFDVNDRFYMRGDLTQYEFDEQDINSFQLGLGVKF